MSNTMKDYFDALDRLKKGTPQRVKAGTPITNDAVSLEAGRGKGTIKRSRASFSDLIEAIEAAARAQSKPESDRLEQTRGQALAYRTKYEAALQREVWLIREVAALKLELAQLRGGQVVPIMGMQAEAQRYTSSEAAPQSNT